jgi:hypothetical protein
MKCPFANLEDRDIYAAFLKNKIAIGEKSTEVVHSNREGSRMH